MQYDLLNFFSENYEIIIKSYFIQFLTIKKIFVVNKNLNLKFEEDGIKNK